MLLFSMLFVSFIFTPSALQFISLKIFFSLVKPESDILLIVIKCNVLFLNHSSEVKLLFLKDNEDAARKFQS